MRWRIAFAGASGAVMVAMGAYAAHAGGGEQARAWLESGVQYGLPHSIALLAIAAIAERAPASRLLTLAAFAFAAGIVLFSGTLFIRALGDIAWVSKATPLGGMSFIAGWLLLATYGLAARWR
ncbi:MAG: DUF423 domain-containing protein [Alphaproteobacteria bacterium]